MAQSVRDKINRRTSGNRTGMVGSGLQANQVKVRDEYVRQVERNLNDIEEATVAVGGSVKTLKRKYEEISATAEKIDRDIDTLLTRGKSDLASAAQADLNTKQQLAQEYNEQWQQQHKEYQKMLDAKLTQ